MDVCRKTTPEDFPPVDSPTLFVPKSGEATFMPGGKIPAKYKIREILAMEQDIKDENVSVYFTWEGKWRDDIFKLRPEDTDVYMEQLKKYL